MTVEQITSNRKEMEISAATLMMPRVFPPFTRWDDANLEQRIKRCDVSEAETILSILQADPAVYRHQDKSEVNLTSLRQDTKNELVEYLGIQRTPEPFWIMEVDPISKEYDDFIEKGLAKREVYETAVKTSILRGQMSSENAQLWNRRFGNMQRLASYNHKRRELRKKLVEMERNGMWMTKDFKHRSDLLKSVSAGMRKFIKE